MVGSTLRVIFWVVMVLKIVASFSWDFFLLCMGCVYVAYILGCRRSCVRFLVPFVDLSSNFFLGIFR